MAMRKTVIMTGRLVVIMIVGLLLFQTGCTGITTDPAVPEETADSAEVSSGVDIEDDFAPDTTPGMIDPLDFARELLKTNPDISETELRVEMYRAGYFASEIRATINIVMPKD